MVLCELCGLKNAKLTKVLMVIKKHIAVNPMDVTLNNVHVTTGTPNVPQMPHGLHVRAVTRVPVDVKLNDVTLKTEEAYKQAIHRMSVFCTALETLLLENIMDGYIGVLQTEYRPNATCVTVTVCMRQFDTPTAAMTVEPRNPKSTPKEWKATQGWKKVHWFACAGSLDDPSNLVEPRAT